MGWRYNDTNPGQRAADRQRRWVGPAGGWSTPYAGESRGRISLCSRAGADVGDQVSFGGQLMQGSSGSVTVQPKTAEWYRSQVTKVDPRSRHRRHDGRRPSDRELRQRSIRPGIRARGSRFSRCFDQNNEIVSHRSDRDHHRASPRTIRRPAPTGVPTFATTRRIRISCSRSASSPSTITTDFVSTQAFPEFSEAPRSEP